MATAPRTWTFTTDLEGLVEVGDSANIPVNWDSVPTSLEFGLGTGGSNDFERARGPLTAGKDWTVLFPGIPANAVVTDLTCTGANFTDFAVGTLTAYRYRVRVVTTGGTTVHSASELVDFTNPAPGNSGVEQSIGGSSLFSAAVDAAYQSATTLVALELQFDRTGGGANDNDFDDIAITPTYNIPVRFSPHAMPKGV